MVTDLPRPDDWILLSTCIARMGELHPIYRSYRGYAWRDLESAIGAGRAALRGQRLGSEDCSAQPISEPITGRHRLDLIHNCLSERRAGPYGDNVLFRNVEINWNRIAKYLRMHAAKQWSSLAENLKDRAAATPGVPKRVKGPVRGPTQGTTGFQALDQMLIPRISELMKAGARSPYAAALKLHKEIAGSGSPESKAKRLSAHYRKQHPGMDR